MNIPWKKIGIGLVKALGFGQMIAPFVPKRVADWIIGIGNIVESIEVNKEGATGPEKAAAVESILKATVENLETAVGKDLVTNDKIITLWREIVVDEVALRNVAARLQQRREDLQDLVDDIKAKKVA